MASPKTLLPACHRMALPQGKHWNFRKPRRRRMLKSPDTKLFPAEEQNSDGPSATHHLCWAERPEEHPPALGKGGTRAVFSGGGG